MESDLFGLMVGGVFIALGIYTIVKRQIEIGFGRPRPIFSVIVVGRDAVLVGIGAIIVGVLLNTPHAGDGILFSIATLIFVSIFGKKLPKPLPPIDDDEYAIVLDEGK